MGAAFTSNVNLDFAALAGSEAIATERAEEESGALTGSGHAH